MRSPREAGDDELDIHLRQLAHDESFAVDTSRLARLTSHAESTALRRRSRRRSRLPWLAGSLAVLVGTGIAAPALADGFQQLAHTGRYSQPTTESDGTEWITSTGDDYSQFVASLYPEWLPLPPSVSAEAFKKATTTQLSTVEGESQAVMFESSYEMYARCVWLDDWLLADAAGDQPRADAAAKVLKESVTWPSTVAIAGGGYLDHLTSTADAAALGDSAVLRDHKQSDCDGMPDGLRE